MLRTICCRYFQRAFLACLPIGGLAGLVGLGGGEFRLPVLTGLLRFPARAAVPFNLLVSLVTLAVAFAVRGHAVPLAALGAHGPEMAGLVLGGMASAFHGARLVRRLSDRRLAWLIGALLFGLGLLLLAEAAFGFRDLPLVPAGADARLAAGLAIGLAVGMVSSVLGVAGGELLIPVLMFVFGADIRTAGSASIVISLAIVATGLWRFHRMNAIPEGRGVQRIAFAMSAGSVIGAAVGGLVVAVAPVLLLKVLLGAILLGVAVRSMAARP